MAERVLVTGAGGFVGRQILAPLVAAGAEVHAVGRQVPAAPMPGVTWHRADLLAGEGDALVARLRPARLVHAAWYVAHGRFWNAPENADWVRASVALAQGFAAAGGRRFLGIGTCAEYAVEPADGLPWAEGRAIAPVTPYGAAKAEAAAAIAAIPGLDVAWGRLFFLFGPGEHPDRLVPSVMRALLAGREAACASGQPVRDFCSTAYAGRALAALAMTEATGGFNVASGQGITIAALARRIGTLCGRPELVALGRLPDRDGEPPMMVADIGRLRRETGFGEAFDLDRDLAETQRWWQANG